MKNYKNFLKKMHCDVHYYPAKFETKIQLVYRATKRQIVLWGKFFEMSIMR